MPLVSVVIPTFGRPALVTRAVESALAQTCRDIEVIVVVDGDDPATIAALRLVADARLRVLSHPAKRGAGPARDTGADAATGRWVAFLDDDDEWLPEKLARQLEAAPDERTVVMTLIKIVMPSGDLVRPVQPYDGSKPLDQWLFGRQSWFKGGEAMIQTSALMFPRAMFETLHFCNPTHEEWEITLRAVKQLGYRFVTVPEPLVIYHAPQGGSLSNGYTLERCIAWADDVDGLLTPEGYSGFALTVASQVRTGSGHRNRAFAGLLRKAFVRGRPTPRQLFAFALIWLLPHDLRRQIRMRGVGSKLPRLQRT